ncbi:hypothetical protein KP509_26G052200 [Ceratopteris richardii]|uniref:Uncharacterized protein n=1 Tax=Ceratopteris richardii TaxID=49495 RepID=A0A8T2RKY0_CERRI|nr:hypothetical protein KP509_26G052200 [Ceratopteris richardii]
MCTHNQNINSNACLSCYLTHESTQIWICECVACGAHVRMQNITNITQENVYLQCTKKTFDLIFTFNGQNESPSGFRILNWRASLFSTIFLPKVQKCESIFWEAGPIRNCSHTQIALQFVSGHQDHQLSLPLQALCPCLGINTYHPYSVMSPQFSLFSKRRYLLVSHPVYGSDDRESDPSQPPLVQAPTSSLLDI